MKVNFKITEKCSANCACCESRKKTYKSAYGNSKNLVADFDLAKKIIDEMSKYEDNYLAISGGEPSEVENLEEVIQFAKSKDIRVKVNTNGWNVNEEWLDRMYKAGMDCVMFSFYSIDKSIYTYLRGSDPLYYRALEAIEQLKDFKKIHSDLVIRLQTVIMKANFRGLPDLLELAINSGFDALSTMYLCNVQSYPQLQLNRDEITEFKTCVKPKLKDIISNSQLSEVLKAKAKDSIDAFFVDDNEKTSDYCQGIYRVKDNYDCNLKNNFLAIYSNGDVAPCYSFDYVRREEYIDNMLGKSFTDVYNGDIYKSFWVKGRDYCKYCPNGKHVWIGLK